MSRRSHGRRPTTSETAPGSVRIIGGELRGRRLDYATDPRTRPMKDRVREAIFNLLGDIDETTVVDLFAGTGALGFEALSRGAKSAIFLEQHFPTADAIRKNASLLQLEDRCQIAPGDTFLWFRRDDRLSEMAKTGPWLVFCSPPYELYVSRDQDMRHLLDQLWQVAPQESAFVVETDDRFDPSLLPEPDGWMCRSYPPAQVHMAWKDAEAR